MASRAVIRSPFFESQLLHSVDYTRTAPIAHRPESTTDESSSRFGGNLPPTQRPFNHLATALHDSEQPRKPFILGMALAIAGVDLLDDDGNLKQPIDII